MQPVRVRQGLSVNALSNDPRGNGAEHKEKDKLKPKISRARNAIRAKGEKVQEQQVRQKRGLEEDSSEILALIGKR